MSNKKLYPLFNLYSFKNNIKFSDSILLIVIYSNAIIKKSKR